MSTVSSREKLIEAAKKLLWQQGYESTSPRDIMSESGVGQGSLYHHFEGKRDLAAAALDAVADELIASAEAVLGQHGSPLDGVLAWLSAPRDALKGCRLGRHATEAAVVSDDVLRRPVARYFKAIEKTLRARLANAVHEGELPHGTDPDQLAAMLVSVVQGGYLVARVLHDPERQTDAIRAAIALLDAQRTNTRRR